MDNEETADNRYPSGFEHIKEMVDNAKEQIRQIDELIENLPDNHRGPTLRLNPPGTSWSRQPVNRNQQRAGYEKRKEEIRQETFDRVEQDLQASDPQMAVTVQESVLADLFPDVLKAMDANELQQPHNTSKESMDDMQRFSDTILSRYKTRTDKTPDVKSPENPNQKASTLSQRFMLRFLNNGKDIMDPSDQLDIDKERE